MKWDFIFRGETEDLNETARATAGGSFVQLSQGGTHYEIDGPSTGRTVVLVHGFSVPYFIWDPTFQALISADLRTLRYDLYGRGYSDRPSLIYDMELFVRQLRDLLDKLDVQTADVIGLSMGGAIASAFTERFPARVRSLALIDPIGTQRMKRNLLYEALVIPGLGELVLGLSGNGPMVRSVASDFFDRREISLFQSRYRDQMRYRGFKRAILSTVRHRMVDGFPQVYAQLGKLNTPVLLIWGQDDHTIPFEQSQAIIDLVPRVEFHVIPGCGHVPHYEKPDIVNPLLVGFLRSK
jgi:pimeloyl-ACP methyl ester carboxylesterase